MSTLKSRFFTFLISLFVIAGTVTLVSLLRVALTPYIGENAMYILYLLAVITSAQLFGFWAGFAATILSVLSVVAFVMHDLSIDNIFRSIIFLGVATVCALICGLARKNRLRVSRLLVDAKDRIANEQILREQIQAQDGDRAEIIAKLEIAVAEKEKSKIAAERANQAKSMFLAQMSHEIRSPMNAILGFTQILQDDGLPKQEEGMLLERIRVNSEHLIHIIDDILDLSKFESGKISTSTSEFSLQDLVQDVLASFRPLAAMKEMKIFAKLDASVPAKIISDPLRLRQILINLLGNAVKFSEKGSIEIRVHADQNGSAKSPTSSAQGLTQIHFEVEDSGEGLSHEQITKIFQPFQQADSSANRKFGGTGLGLILSRHIAEALGGELHLLWSHVGKGSCFRFSIASMRAEVNPILAPKDEQRVLGPVREAPVDLESLKILLAEDSPDGAAIVTRLLSRAKAEVVLATNGFEVLNQAQQQVFDLILMDIQMPGMDGLEATRRLRESGFTNPILALTAHALPEEKARSLSAGCDAHLTKPVDSSALLQTIKAFTGRR